LNTVRTPSWARTGRDEPHRRVEGARVQEPDAELGDGAGDGVRRQLDGHAPGLEQVGGPATAGGGPVAVLGDPNAAGRHHERGDGRDVERAGAVAPRPAGVEQRPGHVDGDGRVEHGADEARDLAGRLPLRAERHEQARDLGRLGLAAHDGREDLPRGRLVEVVAAEQSLEDGGPAHGGGLDHGRLLGLADGSSGPRTVRSHTEGRYPSAPRDRAVGPVGYLPSARER
jgi:hypothetical protein